MALVHVEWKPEQRISLKGGIVTNDELTEILQAVAERLADAANRGEQLIRGCPESREKTDVNIALSREDGPYGGDYFPARPLGLRDSLSPGF